MTTDSSTYTYKSGEQETVTLRRGTADPHGHALLRIKHDDGKTLDCYVNTAWLRDQLDNLDPRPLTPDAITDEMVERGAIANWRGDVAHPDWTFEDISDEDRGWYRDNARAVLTAALTEPPARPEGAEDIERLIRDAEIEGQGADNEALANYLAARLTDPTRKEA